MPRLLHVALSVLTTVLLSQGLALSASAADPNTYRPGQAYLKAAATSHQVCEQQCQGDAQCRGWNFVRPNPKTASGICEFNARVASPVRSAISMSGAVITSVDPLMSRAIPAGTRTRRVGTPPVAVRKPAATPIQVRRMPVPLPQQAVRPTIHTQPAAQKPQLEKMTDTRNHQMPARSNPVSPGQELTPQQQYYRQQFLAERQRAEQIRAQQQNVVPQQNFQGLHMARPRADEPRLVQPQPSLHQQPVQAKPDTSAQLRQSQSLYGSLHDDLTKNLTPVARPRTAPDNLENPDVPVSTSRAAPAKPVQTAPLRQPVIAGLAGGE